MDDAVETIEFLARSPHRVGALEALLDGPRDRGTLRAETGASRPTVGRVLGDFEEYRWVARDGSEYALTRLGAYVAERFLDLRDAMTVEAKLRDVWRWLPLEMPGFDVELFADAVVSYPGRATRTSRSSGSASSSALRRRCGASTTSSTSRATWKPLPGPSSTA